MSELHFVPGQRLGRKAVKRDTRTLRLARYLTAELPPPPLSVNWAKGITSWGKMLNDRLGCCTIAGVGHAIQVWTANIGTELTVPDAAIEEYYEKWDGYNPANPATDEGGVELDVLTQWKAQGFTGHGLLGFADAQPTNTLEVKQAIHLFGGVYIGVALPASAMGMGEWDSVPNANDASTVPGSWGGHCVFVCGYDAETLTCITWGALMKMTWSFWAAYVDEVHACLSPDWIGAKGAPNGFALTDLENDLTSIR